MQNIKDDKYWEYVKSGEAAVVSITKKFVKSIDSSDKWIDVIEQRRNFDINEEFWSFSIFIIELFSRKQKPNYLDACSEEEKKYITWKTAHEDIDEQRLQGIKGIRYKICLKAINKNKGKFYYKKVVFNKTFNRIVPEGWFIKESCEWRKIKKFVKPEYTSYKIISVKKCENT